MERSHTLTLTDSELTTIRAALSRYGSLCREEATENRSLGFDATADTLDLVAARAWAIRLDVVGVCLTAV